MYQNIFFIDLDGTLIQETKPEHFYIPSQLNNAICQLKDINCLSAICTARQPNFVEKMFGNLFQTGVFFNGSYIVYEKTAITQKAYSEKHLLELLQYAQFVQCGLILQGTAHAWSYNINAQYFPLLNQIYNLDDYMRDITLRGDQNVYSVDVFFLNKKQYKLASQKIRPPYSLDYHEGDWTGVLTSTTINKGTATISLCQHIGISPMNCYAIGNSKNDIPLFQAVGKSIAVKNACPELLSIAHSITDSCMNNGVITAIHSIISSHN